MRQLNSATILQELWLEDKAKVTSAFSTLESVSNVEGTKAVRVVSHHSDEFLSVEEILGNKHMMLLVKIPVEDWDAKTAELEAYVKEATENTTDEEEGKA